MFKLPKLKYSFNALEPYFDAKTMEIHYTKHHQTYLNNFNALIESYSELQKMKAEDILKNLISLKVTEVDWIKIKNHGGGYVNHNIFWKSLSPKKEIDKNLIEEIKKEFGTLKKFKKEFENIAKTHFGSGWTWFVRDENKKLKVYSLANQDSPYTLGHEPIFCLDVWEHAYYLKYENRRAEFVENFWKVLKMI